MESVNKVQLAEMLAVYAHYGQTDKAGAPYITHPRAVAAQMDADDEKTVAYLHDVLEDTFVTEQTLRNLFGDRICDAVVSMTHCPVESYEQYVRRLGQDPIARKVKLADLRHNMDLSRLPVVTSRDRKRQEKYKKAARYLENMICQEQ